MRICTSSSVSKKNCLSLIDQLTSLPPWLACPARRARGSPPVVNHDDHVGGDHDDGDDHVFGDHVGGDHVGGDNDDGDDLVAGDHDDGGDHVGDDHDDGDDFFTGLCSCGL